ncbi:stress-induced-phosphoprotein 1 [Strigomonas culicis]|uniref:Stress-induced-phosphoprotein 1 n=1 Tax=Strigomonas culicis TaxID=28005 RepID=S9VHH1_9TRYP|nr:stress-induced-phosphoprotein 1 [Strigomonas culicis]EPY27800.1 stress-induced-phosphoprotein 1 [Strigomonas culicis]|eukprot:EPY26571.1 stress-induced-phosphoprotein 1 [Strigomonas culicis]
MDATELKNKGNQEYSAGNYVEAINYFSKAIQVDGSNHVLYSNRSASYASLHKYKDALDDADKCISIKPEWAKGYVRRGAALHGMRRYDDAEAAYQKGLQMEPENTACKQGVVDVRMAKASDARDPVARVFTPDAFRKIQEHPKLSLLLMQPDYVKMLDTVIRDPSQAKLYMEDQRFAMTLMFLSGMKIPTNDDEEEQRHKPAAAKKETQQPKAEVVLTDNQKEALALKEEGNKLYLSKQFDEALSKYQAALEKDPQNTLFILNCTAVYFEKGEYETCIAECEKGVEHGRENRCDYTIIGKLMTRQAFCLQKMKKYEDAVALYKKALVEWRNPDTLAKLNACEKEFQKAVADAYIDPEIARQKKEEGNEFFKNDKYPEAVAAYTEAIKRNPTEHTAYSNRAATYLKLGAFNDALKDAEKCVELKPDFVKGYTRKGHAYFWTKQYNRALQAYDEGLKIDPNNADCKDGRYRTMMKIQEMASGQDADGDEAAKRAMSDPEIAAIMQDSYMQLVLQEMQNDPKRVQDYMRDPSLAEKINKLVSAGIIRFGGQ